MNEEKKEKAESLTRKASKSIFWSLSSTAGTSILRFVSTAILARILMPEEFGIVGMALLVTGIVTLFGKLGMGPALIQKKEIDQEDLSTAFWTSLMVGSGLAVAGILSAPLAADFFKNPPLKGVIALLSLNFIFSALASVQATLLTRELKFKRLAQIEVSCTVVRIAVILSFALTGYGFWSIVFGILSERIVKTIVFFFQSPWRPARVFSKERFQVLFRFGRNIYGQSFLGYFNANMDYIVTGRVLGAESLAFYQFSYNIPHLVLTHIANNVNQVMFPIYSRVQNDRKRLARGYLKTVRFIALVTFPLMFGLMLTADDFILTVYGSKWAPSIVPLRVLCLSGAVRSIFEANGALLRGIGRPDMGFKYSLAVFPVAVILIIGFSRWGIIGISSVMVILAMLTFFLVHFSIKKISLRMGEYFRNLLPCLTACLMMGCGVWLFRMAAGLWGAGHPVKLLGSILVGGGTYLGSLRFFFRSLLDELSAFLKVMLEKRK